VAIYCCLCYLVFYFYHLVFRKWKPSLKQSCAPSPPRRRRHFADAAAADSNWSARRRRRRRPNVGVAPAPFSWRVHVMLYTSNMLLDFCNAVYNKAWTLTKAVRTMRACFTIALDTQMKHGSVKTKAFSWTILWKWYLMLKVSYRTFFGNLVNKADGTVKDFNSVYCNNCL